MNVLLSQSTAQLVKVVNYKLYAVVLRKRTEIASVIPPNDLDFNFRNPGINQKLTICFKTYSVL